VPPGTRQKFGNQPYQSFLCFDVEATCSGGKDFDYPNEIIVSLFKLHTLLYILRGDPVDRTTAHS
jgi:hypothetical protein